MTFTRHSGNNGDYQRSQDKDVNRQVKKARNLHSVVRVYRLNPDGTKGEFLREEESLSYQKVMKALTAKERSQLHLKHHK